MAAVSGRYKVKMLVLPSSGERLPLIVRTDDGLIEEETSTYVVRHLRERGLSPNTVDQHLRSIVMLLEWADRQSPPIQLKARCLSTDLLSRDEIFNLRQSLRLNMNRKRAKDPRVIRSTGKFVAYEVYYSRCRFACDYLVWHSEQAIFRIPANEPVRAQEARLRVETMKKVFVGDLPAPRSRSREGLTEEAYELLLSAVVPGANTNPFPHYLQARNFALILLYFELGFRRADALKLKGEDLHLYGERPFIRIMVRHDEPQDPRRNEPRHKTFGREVAVSSVLEQALKAYLVVRRELPGAKKCPYVFLSRKGDPLSSRSVNDIFKVLRDRVPGLPADLTTHVGRHTANDRFAAAAEDLGWNDDEKLRVGNYHFGWSLGSKQGDRYRGRSTRENASKTSIKMQERLFGKLSDRD